MCPKVDPNFSEVSQPKSELIPGEYLCRIVKSEIRTGKESGNEYVAWRLETLPDKRTVFHNTSLEGPGAGMFKHFVHCAGDRKYEGGGFDTDELTGKIVSMKLTVEKVTNRSGNEISVFKMKEVNEATMEQLEKLNQTNDSNDDIPF